MRWLIGVYLLIGVVELALAIVAGVLGASSLSSGDRRGGGAGGEEVILLTLILMMVACIPLIAAYGLWRRWRIVRLVLLGLSWWTLAVSAASTAVAIAVLAGLTDGQVMGESPRETLVTAFGLAVFAAWQAWVLMRPDVRESFRCSRQTVTRAPSH